jgi:hypothetical protein
VKKYKLAQIVALPADGSGNSERKARSTSLQANPDYHPGPLTIECGGRVAGIRKSVAVIFFPAEMKAAVVFFDGNAQHPTCSNRLAMLNGNLVAVCPRSNQIIREQNTDLPVGSPGPDLPALRRFFNHICEKFGRGRGELRRFFQSSSGRKSGHFALGEPEPDVIPLNAQLHRIILCVRPTASKPFRCNG